MAVLPLPVEPETEMVESAQGGNRESFQALVSEWRRPLFGYIYRMVTHPQDAEDLLQDVLVRALESLPRFRGESRFKTWLFGIATHVCLDHLRRKKRWRVEAQLIGEEEAGNDPSFRGAMIGLMSHPEFRFEIREHIAFCFSCIGRTLPPEEQAALLLREMLGFSAGEAAGILEVSEPVFRHRLQSARGTMTKTFDGLCRLVGKGGACWQCAGLRDVCPEDHRGEDLVEIKISPGVAITPESLLDARLEMVRAADLEGGRTRTLHVEFFKNLSAREENRA